MRKRFMFIATLAIFSLAFLVPGGASAQSGIEDINFPIAELGGCMDINECKLYCDDPENARACKTWATNNGLHSGGSVSLDEGDIDSESQERDLKIRRFLENNSGPGGCTTPEECGAYCSMGEHGQECFEFAKQNDLISTEEIERIEREIDRAHEQRAGPGGCQSEQQCHQYCSAPENTRQCIDFAVSEGHMSAQEATRILRNIERVEKFRRGEVDIPRVDSPRVNVPEIRDIRGPEPDIDVEKARRVLEEQDGPGGCSNFQQCEAFCNNPQNEETCFNFAIEHGLMDSEHATRLRRMMSIEGPGGCRGRQCEVYCEQAGREEECLEFAVQNDLIPPEEVAQIKKFMNAAKDGGPGGCSGRECEIYCNDPNHRDECFAFAKEHNLIPQEEVEKIEKILNVMETSGGPGGCRDEQQCMQYCSDPSRIEECSAFAVEAGLFSPEDAAQIQMMQEFMNSEHGDIDVGPHMPGADRFGPSREEMESMMRDNITPPDGVDAEAFRSQFEQEFNQRYEEEYRRRMESFGQQYQGQFDGESTGGHVPDYSDFVPQVGDGFDGTFPVIDQQDGQEDHDFNPQESFGGRSEIHLKVNSSNLFDLYIYDSDGLKSFSLVPAQGSAYGGGIGSCSNEYKSSTVRLTGEFPYRLTYIDCSGNSFERQIGEAEVYGRPAVNKPEMDATPPTDIDGTDYVHPQEYEVAPEEFNTHHQEQFETQYQEEFERRQQEMEEEIRRQMEEGSVPEGYEIPEGFDPEQYEQFYDSGTSPQSVVPKMMGAVLNAVLNLLLH